MHRVAMTIAILGMLVLAGVGYFSERTILGCTIRSLTGAAILYVVSLVAMKLVLAIMVSAVVSSNTTVKPEKANREHGQ
jgi:hypothetical protein